MYHIPFIYIYIYIYIFVYVYVYIHQAASSGERLASGFSQGRPWTNCPVK